VAFLRAINVGGHVVKMAELKALFEELAFREVSTVIASGNVLFSTRSADAAALERRIERHLERALGYEVATFLRSPQELADVAAFEPFPGAAPAAGIEVRSVLFLKAPLGAQACQALMALRTPTDEFHVHGREAYWLRRGRVSETKVTGARLERALGGPTTARNVTTVRKLAAAAAS
jgi:uncharacterized protein (DUF1697 family)